MARNRLAATRLAKVVPAQVMTGSPAQSASLAEVWDFARLDQKLDAALNRGDGYSLGLREPVALDRHQPGDGSGRGSAAYRACIHLFRSPTSSAPLADDTKASTKPLPFQRAP